MARSLLDYHFVQPDCMTGEPEPTLRDLIYRYYVKNIYDEAKALAYAREYVRQIERLEKIRAESHTSPRPSV